MPITKKSSRPAPGEPDKRRASRREISYPVAIETVEDGAIHPCMILDISETGAKLTLRESAKLPDLFMLRLAGRRTAARHCRLVWREGDTIGVRFIETED